MEACEEGGEEGIGDGEGAEAAAEGDSWGGGAVEIATAGDEEVVGIGEGEVVAGLCGGMFAVVAFDAVESGGSEGGEGLVQGGFAEVEGEGVGEDGDTAGVVDDLDGGGGVESGAFGVGGFSVTEPTVEGFFF